MFERQSDQPKRRPPIGDVAPLADRIIFWAGIGFVLIMPTIIGLFTANSTASWVALLSGAFVVLMSKFDSLAEFSLGPLKARMRDVVAQATATIDQLQDLAVSMTSAFLTSLIASSFMGGMSNDRRFRMHDELMEQLKSLGATDKQLERADAEWRNGVGIIYHRTVLNTITEENKGSTARSHSELTNEFQKLLDFPNLRTAPPRDIEDFARSRNLLTPTVQSWIDDYDHFQQTGEIRRREEFMKE